MRWVIFYYGAQNDWPQNWWLGICWNSLTNFVVPNWSPNCEPACQDIMYKVGPYPVIDIINAVLTPITGLTNWISGVISPYLGGPIAPFINGCGAHLVKLTWVLTVHLDLPLVWGWNGKTPTQTRQIRTRTPTGKPLVAGKPRNPKLLARNIYIYIFGFTDQMLHAWNIY